MKTMTLTFSRNQVNKMMDVVSKIAKSIELENQFVRSSQTLDKHELKVDQLQDQIGKLQKQLEKAIEKAKPVAEENLQLEDSLEKAEELAENAYELLTENEKDFVRRTLKVRRIGSKDQREYLAW